MHMVKSLRNLFTAFAALACAQTAWADNYDFTGIYSFSSTTTVLNDMSGWASKTPSEFEFSIDQNHGDDASQYPFLVRGFLPENRTEGVQTNTLKAKYGNDGETLVIVAGEAGKIYDETTHLCAYNGQGFDGGVGELVMTRTSCSTFTFAQDIVATWHQVIDLGFYKEDTHFDIVKYTDILVKKAEAEFTDFVGAYHMSCTNVPLTDKLMQVNWIMPESDFRIYPNDGSFDEMYDYMIYQFFPYSFDKGDGTNSRDDMKMLPAYRAADGKSLIIDAGEEHHIAEGGTHYCLWSGQAGKDGGSAQLVMVPTEEGSYTFTDDISWIYHNYMDLGFFVIDEPINISYITDIVVTFDLEGINEIKMDRDAQDVPACKAGIFTLDGRRVNQPTHPGIYIQNGRRVVIK